MLLLMTRLPFTFLRLVYPYLQIAFYKPSLFQGEVLNNKVKTSLTQMQGLLPEEPPELDQVQLLPETSKAFEQWLFWLFSWF